MKILKLRITVISLSLVALIAFTGCATSTSSPTTVTPRADTSREASGRGSNLCIINNTAMQMQVLWRGYPDARPLPPAGRNCNSGYERGFTPDVAGKLQYKPVAYADGAWLSWEFDADAGSAVGMDFFKVWYTSTARKYGFCNHPKVGYSASMQTDWLRGTASRNPDTDANVEYILTLSPAEGENFATDIDLICTGTGML